MTREKDNSPSTYRFLTTLELRALGYDKHGIGRLVADGRLIRVRTGRYVAPGLPDDILTAARLGVRLDCVSLLRVLDVFVLEKGPLHVQASHGASRLPKRPKGMTCHWRASASAHSDLAADIIEALAQACRCQPPREAIATLDSAWHLGLIDEAGIAEVFARLPLRFRPLRALLDRRSESGPETLMRLLLRALGCDVKVQPWLPGVGRVDFVVDGWLIIECDSEAHHAGWEQQKEDRRRDLVAAGLGYTTIRPIAEDIMYARERTVASIRAVLAAHTGGAGPNSSKSRTKRPASRSESGSARDRRSLVRTDAKAGAWQAEIGG